ncbi:MAG: MerR family transcriptional regulator [Polyangiaceae bacterium]
MDSVGQGRGAVREAGRTLGDEGGSEADGADRAYKMKDLCDKAGVSRQLVHFYIQQGLLPEGRKTGRNMAYYSERHLERLLLVRKLQHEHFLPLKAIRALLDERDESFSPAQQKHMRDVRAAMPEGLRGSPGPRKTVDAHELAERVGLTRQDLEEIVDAGLLAVAEEQDLSTGQRRTVLAGDDAWRLSVYSELRAAGFTRERGFSMRDLAMYDEAVQRLVMKEARLIATRASALPAAEVAELLARALPVIGTLLSRLHDDKARTLLATL